MMKTNKEKNVHKKFQYSNKRVKTPAVLQMEAVECGAAALSMVLAYYGKYIPLEVLRIDCGVSRDGTKASNMVKAAKKYGLESHGYSLDIPAMKDIKFPAIIFWQFMHFVVLEGFKGGNAYINDPAVGRRIVPFEDFDSSFTGVILTFEKTEDFVPSGKKPIIWTLIKERLNGTKTIISYLVLLGLFMLVPGLVLPAYSRFFIDTILINKMTGFLKPLLFAMGATAAVQTVIMWLQSKYLLKFEMKLSLTTSANFILHLFKLPVVFFAQRMPGELCGRIAANDSIANLIASRLASVTISVFSVIFYLILMLRYDVVLTVLCVFSIMIDFVFLKLVAERMKNGMLKNQIESGKLYGILMSGISMIDTLKASGIENDFFMQWSGQQAKVVVQNQKMARLSLVTSLLPSLLKSFLDLGILVTGAFRVMDGHITIGMLIAFQSLQGSITTPVNDFLALISQLQTCKADMQRIDDVMHYPAEQRYRDDLIPPPASKKPQYLPVERLQGYVQLSNIEFGYSRLGPPLISDFSLSLQPGTRVALVGGSGSGKSTVGKLISSLYQPWSGTISYDGKLVSEIDREVFTNSVSVVDQDIFLFNGTIKDNLTMWDTSIPEESYIQAAKDACIHDVISSRSDGYFSQVDEGGKNFSGGQRQRLEIARALTRNPRILIMDEATSALDPVIEQQVDNNIRRRGCTCIIIAHRLSTIRDSDEILVLETGKIVERGTHEQLVALKGVYNALIQNM